MKKNSGKRRRYQEFGFDEFDFDDEEDIDLEEDMEDDFEEDQDAEWEDEFPAAGDKKIMFFIAAGGVCVLAAVITVFALIFQSSKNERETVQTQIALANMERQPAEEEKTPLEEQEDGNSDLAGSSEEEKLPEASKEPDVQAEIQVGALDDEQDPQADGTAGTEANGAEVTVSAISKDETGSITMGIDVSKYQGTIDWAKVKESGVEFAMVRVGYRAKSTGEIFEDPTARYNMQEAQAVGIKLGAYLFSCAVTEEEARQEAAFTKDIIARYKITYPVAYNCEDFGSPDSRQYGIDAAARTRLACAFLDEIGAAGYTPMFYAAKGELEGSAMWDTQTLAGKYKIWVAQYPDQPYPQTGASSYTGTHAMWQYTSQGTVAGISKKTDVNIAYFGYTKEAEAKDETPAEVVEANPEVGIIFTEVNETVTAKQETNLRSEPSTLNDASIVGKLVHGDTATRTGIGHNGWSRVIYNGQTLYAVTSYLTTDMEDTGQQAPPQGPVYTPVSEQVTAKMETNLRTEPSTASSDTVVGLLHNGEVLTRTAIGDNGWSQLDYNGQTVYAVSSYLTLVQ